MSVTADTLKNRETTMKRILIVEDEQAIREMVGFALKKAELYFEEVADAEQALVAIASNPPDLILLDIGLPAGDGFWILDMLRGSPGPGTMVPVIVLTARADSETREKAYAAGANGFGQKPIDPDDLLASIPRLTPGHHARLPFGGQARDRVRRGGQAVGGELHDP